ncbi:DUF5994 family protein, partial [Actinomadura verrucosospora]
MRNRLAASIEIQKKVPAMWTTTERRTTISLSPPSTPRLRLRPAAPPGSVRTALDGAWWPRSADPVAELPGLVL